MSKKMLQAAAGNAGGDNLYVEDVFSTYLYTGNSANQTIINGIDLAGEGGLVWTKRRDNSQLHGLFDTERGVLKYISSNTSDAETTASNTLKAFNSDGFQLGPVSYPVSNQSGEKGVSWTFRKAEKFFDVVTYAYQGNSTGTTAQIPHNLGSTPAFIIIKAVDKAENFICWHKDLNGYLKMGTQGTDSLFTATGAFGSLTPSMTDTHFTVGYDGGTNFPGYNYVAYLFAHNAGGFGDDGDESIIKCGSFTNSGGSATVSLGWEPQYILAKQTDGADNWFIADIMRGLTAGPLTNDNLLNANDTVVEYTTTRFASPTPDGFIIESMGTSATYIYIAIRRPMKTPESGTEVFATAQRDTTAPIFEGGFPVDAAIIADVSGAWANSPSMGSRLTGTGRLATSNSNAEGADGLFMWDYMNGWGDGSGSYPEYYSWMFKRATGFFDVVAYTSTTSAINHNLGVSPELVIYKSRTAGGWYTMVATNGFGELNSSGAWGGAGNGSGLGPNLANATATTITGAGNLYGSGVSMVTYLFATLAGVSKVGSFTHTYGTATNVDCGFANGARFVLWKKYDGTDGWQVYDSVRGIVAGADPFLQLNSSSAEITEDLIDPYAAGFSVASGKTSGSYIFLAIA